MLSQKEIEMMKVEHLAVKDHLGISILLRIISRNADVYLILHGSYQMDLLLKVLIKSCEKRPVLCQSIGEVLSKLDEIGESSVACCVLNADRHNAEIVNTLETKHPTIPLVAYRENGSTNGKHMNVRLIDNEKNGNRIKNLISGLGLQNNKILMNCLPTA